MTTAATTDLAACLALVSEATPGELHAECVDGTWAVAREPSTIGGAGFAVDGECWNGIDAQAIAAAVNLIRTNGDRLQRALALLAAVESGAWKCVPVIASPEMDASGKQALTDNGVPVIEDSDALVCYAAMLAAAPSPPVESVSPWRPIETAPKDGRYVLLVHQSSGGRPYPGKWSRVDKQWADECECIRIPTHWLPLPAAPAAPGV